MYRVSCLLTCFFLSFNSGLELQYDGVQVKGNQLIIKKIIATGSISSSAGKVIISLLCLKYEAAFCM